MTTTKPTPAAFCPLVYHSGSSKLVLINTGNFPAFEQMSIQTWTWNGTDWTLAAAGLANNPPLRDLTSAAVDPSTGHVVMFGGMGVPGTELMNDTQEWAGASWTQVIANYSATSPQLRKQAYMASMTSPSSEVILFGGSDAHFLNQETWSYAGGTWTQLSPAASPSVRTGASFASNGTTQAVLFGGANESWMLNGVQSWNGTTWSTLIADFVSGSPSVRKDCAMAWYPTGSVYVLFGGQDASGHPLAETWTLNPAGPTWAQQSPTNSPSARIGASMAYDTASSQLILFGGKDAWGNLMNDTWRWTGTNWTQL